MLEFLKDNAKALIKSFSEPKNATNTLRYGNKFFRFKVSDPEKNVKMAEIMSIPVIMEHI